MAKIEWSQYEIDYLVNNRDRMSAREIALVLGRSRSAVLGKVARIPTLASTPKQRPVAGAGRKKKASVAGLFPRVKKKKEGPPRPNVALPAPGWMPDDAIPYLESRYGQCQYMTGDPSNIYDLMVCGHKVHDKDLCPEHYVLCYKPPEKKERTRNNNYLNLKAFVRERVS